MGRRLRRFSFRVACAATALATSALTLHRWRLRPGSASLCAPPEDPAWAARSPAERRAHHIAALAHSGRPTSPTQAPSHSARVSTSTPAETTTDGSYDVLVIGGGVTGLYTAVDAAQRGLRVALVEAADFGSGSTGTQPMLTPGAFPFVQRAIRQRDARWLRRAYDTLECATVWRNTAPHCLRVPQAPLGDAERLAGLPAAAADSGTPWVRTLIPALHSAERLELAVAAIGSTLLSLLSGPLRPCIPLASHVPLVSDAVADMPALLCEDGGSGARGGVVACDYALDGTLAAMSLARTAEALGVTLVNYAPLCALAYAEEEASSGTDPTAPPLVVATIRDDGGALAPPRYIRVHTRGVVNCAGAWADEVRALVPGRERDAVPDVYEGHHMYSYLVVPRDAVRRGGAGPVDSAAPVPFRWLQQHQPNTALQLSSTRYSFSCMVVAPWYDSTLLIGPSITPLRGRVGGEGSGGGGSGAAALASTLKARHTLTSAAFVESADGYAAQRRHILAALASGGLSVDARRVLSCLSTIVPLAGDAQRVPWLEDVWVRGHHIHTFTSSDAADGESPEGLVTPQVGSGGGVASSATALAPPFVHVYGGVGLTARVVAAEAVDTLVHNTTALPAAYKAAHYTTLAHSATRWLRLVDPTPCLGSGASPTAALEEVVSRGYAVHLIDVIARRLHVGYTSPSDAVRALPAVASVAAKLWGWDAARTASEVRATEQFVRGVVVAHGEEGRGG